MVDNNEHLKDVALRIRNAREILGLSEEIMAQNTDITADEYKAYENGEKDFDFTFIYKCAKCLNLDPTDLLKGASPTLTSYEVTRRGGGLPITRKEGYEYKNLASMFKTKRRSLITLLFLTLKMPVRAKLLPIRDRSSTLW